MKMSCDINVTPVAWLISNPVPALSLRSEMVTCRPLAFIAPVSGLGVPFTPPMRVRKPVLKSEPYSVVVPLVRREYAMP